jgi:hypothetical protein
MFECTHLHPDRSPFTQIDSGYVLVTTKASPRIDRHCRDVMPIKCYSRRDRRSAQMFIWLLESRDNHFNPLVNSLTVPASVRRPRSNSRMIIIEHLRGRPPEEWLSAPET